MFMTGFHVFPFEKKPQKTIDSLRFKSLRARRS